jgi:hypothetical protein
LSLIACGSGIFHVFLIAINQCNSRFFSKSNKEVRNEH